MMLDLYRRFGEEFASTVYVEASKAQRLGEKRMQHLVLRVMEDDDVADQMRLDYASDGEGKTAKQVKKVKAKLAKAKTSTKGKTNPSRATQKSGTKKGGKPNAGKKTGGKGTDSSATVTSTPVKNDSICCFVCKEAGHIVRDCPKVPATK